MNWVLLAGSLAGVLGLAAVAWLLGLGGAEELDRERALNIADEVLPGFVGMEALVSDGGEGALVRDRTGRLALLRRHGTRIVAREVHSPLNIQEWPPGAAVTIGSGDWWFGPVHLTGFREFDIRQLERIG